MRWLRSKKFFIFLILGSVGSVLFLIGLLRDLQRTEAQIIDRYCANPLNTLELKVGLFFQPMLLALETAVAHYQQGIYTTEDFESFHHYHATIIRTHPEIESMGIADAHGNELNLIQEDTTWYVRYVNGPAGLSNWQRWANDGAVVDSVWTEPYIGDPRTRPWYLGAVQHVGTTHFTEPYVFNTNHELGITASQFFADPSDLARTMVVALDITLGRLSDEIHRLELGEDVIGMLLLETDDAGETNGSTTSAAQLALISTVPQQLHDAVLMALNGIADEDTAKRWKALPVQMNGERWRMMLRRYSLLNSDRFVLGVIVPERVILHQVHHSKQLIFFGLFAAGMFLLVLIRSQWSMKLSSDQLRAVNQKISEQSVLIERKNRKLSDSIAYAHSLQTNLLQHDKELDRLLPPYFIYYRPKDVVSGDLYWAKRTGDVHYFAIADCTGHGVPGALLSVMALDLLNNAHLQHAPNGVAAMMEYIRNSMAQRITYTEHSHMDGMDISLCRFDRTTSELHFCAAFQSAYLVTERTHIAVVIAGAPSVLTPEMSKGNTHLFRLRGQRIPIGLTDMRIDETFEHTKVTLTENDMLYLVSDGISDQFGGDQFKKFGARAMKELLLDMAQLELNEQRNMLEQRLEKWAEHHAQTDDISCLGIRIP